MDRHSSDAVVSTIDVDKLYRKTCLHIVPILLAAFLFAYLDRVNVGFAKIGMLKDIGMSNGAYGLGAGIFFISYFIFEVPSNLILRRVGARTWFARIMITWGLLSAAMMFVTTPGWFYLLRFLLGAAEAGFLGGVIYYLTLWLPDHRRGRIIALFMMANPLSGVIGNPLSGWILDHFQGTGGLAGWQWLFVLEGLPSVLLGIVIYFALDDRIEDARWLSAEEKSVLLHNVDREAGRQKAAGLREMMKMPYVWVLAVVYFTHSTGLYGFSFWLPTVISESGDISLTMVGLLGAIPGIVAAIAMVVYAAHSDRSGERRWHYVLASIVGALGLAAAGAFSDSTVLAVTGLTVAYAGIMAGVPVFWILPTTRLHGAASAAGIAVINSLGNLSGFVTPSVVGRLNDLTGSASIGLYICALALALGSIPILTGFRSRKHLGVAHGTNPDRITT